MSVRRFNGTSDELQCSIGGNNQTGAFSLAILIRPQAAAACNVMSNYAAATERLGQALNASKQPRLIVGGTGLTGAEIEVTPTTGQWGIWVITKAAGTSKPRWHHYGFDTGVWKHADDSSTLGDPLTQALGTVRFGNGLEGFAKVDFAAAAQWSKVLSDAEIETLRTKPNLLAWKELSPTGLWLFKQAVVTEEVTDQTGNGANQSARTGTEVLAEEPPIPYEAKTVEGKATLTGTGTLSAKGTRSRLGVTALTGSGTLTASGTVEPKAVITIPPAPRPSQITVTAIAEGGKGRGYDLSDEIEGLQWSNVNPGGDEVCTFALNREWFAKNPEVGKGNLLRITAGIDILWQGRVEEIDRTTGDAESLAVTCYGLGNRLGDVTFREIYVDRDLGKWGEPSTQRRVNDETAGEHLVGSFSTGGQEAGSTGPGIVIVFTRFAAGFECAEVWYSGGGIDISQVICDYTTPNVIDATWTERIALCGTDLTGGALDIGTDLDQTPKSGYTVTAGGSGRKYALIQEIYTGAFEGDITVTHIYANIRVFGNHGLIKKSIELAGVSGVTTLSEGFSADQIVGHIIQQASGVSARYIDTFVYVIPQFVIDIPTTPKDAIPQVNAFANADYGTWGPDSPFDNSLNGYFDYTQPDPATQHWFAARKDFEGDLNFHTETSSLYDAVDMSYTDEVGAIHTERFTTTSPDLKAAGLSPRVFPFDAGTMTKAGAQILAEIFLSLFAGFAPARGSGALSGALHHYQRGSLPAFYARADGSNIRIPDILPAETTFSLDSSPDRRTTFPIKRVSIDASGDIPKTSIEFDQNNDSMAVLLAQEAAQAALVG